MLTEHTFHAEQLPVSYGKGPNNGPPIVLLHGITGHRQYWNNVVPALARRGQVFALDLRGHGKSGRAKGEYRYVDYPRDVVQLLRDVVGDAAVVVGHSLGALVAVSWSAAHPELVPRSCARIRRCTPISARSSGRASDSGWSTAS